MKKKKIFLGLAIASAALFSLAACNAPTQSSTSVPESTSVAPSVEKVTVTFNTNGGSAVAAAEVEKGGKVSKPATNPTKASDTNNDYVFACWCEDEALSTIYDFDAAVNAHKTLYAKYIAVSKDTKIKVNGTDEYDTITAALAAIPTDSTETFTITLPKGTYNENGLAYNGKATIIIRGNTAAKYGADVIIKGHGSNMTAEKTRNLISIQGSGNIILENLKLVSDWTRQGAADAGLGSNTQAEVLGTDTKGKTVAYNCSFISHQDTLRTAGKAWFYNCYIEGDTDFIWMEQAGSVALYENCEIVSVYDEQTSTHASYVTAPRMAISAKAGKGLVIYNSTVKESAEAKEKGQQTYLGRSPWTSGYFSQVAYINTECSDIEADVWYKNPIPSDYERTVIGWKMDKATANSLNYKGTDILDDDTVAKEFSGRRTILNRIFNCGKLKYEKDSDAWDIDALIAANGYAVEKDTSKDTLDTDTAGTPVIYAFDGSADQSALCTDFAQEGTKTHYRGGNGATITIPVTGKGYVEVYGYYAGTVETKGGNQGEQVMFFNNGTTSAQIINTYAVYDETVNSVVITAKATTYITKVVFTPDASVVNTPASEIAVTSSSKLECVGVSLKLTAKVTPGNAINKAVKWSSSDTEVADVDAYTGAVTFKKEGTVTFTATACDGSGKTGTITCKPVDPKWTQCEWYTTDSTINEEPGTTEEGVTKGKADGIENFSYGSNTAYKSLGSEFTFKNLAGETITTKNGLKLDSKGELIVATTKSNATLTVIVCHINKVKATLSVKDGATEAKLISNTDSEDGKYTTYVYSLDTPGTWSVTRGDGSSENDPILYAKVVYAKTITWDFKTATPATITTTNIQKTTGTVASDTENVALTVDATCENGKLAYNASGYAQFNKNTIIKVPVTKVGSKVVVVAYPGQSKYTIGTGEGQVAADTTTDTDTYTVTAADVTAGYVEIIATGGAYIYTISLVE